MIRRQTFNCLEDLPAELPAAYALEGIDAKGGRAVSDSVFLDGDAVVELYQRPFAASSLVVDRQVHRDSVNPGVERRLTLEAVEVAERPDESFLEDLAGVL